MKDGMPRNGWRKKREKYQTRALHELPYTEIVISSTDSPHGWHALSLIMMLWWCVPRIHRTVLCGVHHRGQWRKSVPWGCIIQYTWLSYVVSTKGQWRKSAYHEGVYYSVVLYILVPDCPVWCPPEGSEERQTTPPALWRHNWPVSLLL